MIHQGSDPGLVKELTHPVDYDDASFNRGDLFGNALAARPERAGESSNGSLAFRQLLPLITILVPQWTIRSMAALPMRGLWKTESRSLRSRFEVRIVGAFSSEAEAAQYLYAMRALASAGRESDEAL